MNNTQRLPGHSTCLIAMLLSLIAVVVSGCTTTISGNRVGAEPVNAPYRKVLVVALLNADAARSTLERQVVANIRSGGTTARSSSAVAPKMVDAPRSAEQIKAMLYDTDSDALLVLRLADAKRKLGRTQKEKYFEEHLKGDPVTTDDSDSWAAVTPTDPTDDLPDTKLSVDLEASLYDVADDGRVVYTIDVTSRYKGKGGDMVITLSNEIAEALARELRRQGLVN